MTRFHVGYLPKLLIGQILWFFIQACIVAVPSMEDIVTASLQVEQNGPFIFLVLWVIRVQCSVIYFICFSISPATVVSLVLCGSTHRPNQGIKANVVCILATFCFEVRQRFLSAQNFLQCNKFESFGLDCTRFNHF